MQKLFRKIKWLSLVFAAFAPHIVFASNGSNRSAFGEALGKLRDFAGANVSSRQPGEIVGSIVNQALGILGVVAVGLIVYAGGLWVTAAGNDDKVEEAKKIIKTTVVGMIVLGLAYSITRFIISLVA